MAHLAIPAHTQHCYRMLESADKYLKLVDRELLKGAPGSLVKVGVHMRVTDHATVHLRMYNAHRLHGFQVQGCHFAKRRRSIPV